MIRSAFCFAAFAVALQAANAHAAGTGTLPPAGKPIVLTGDEAAPAPIDPARLIKRVVTIGNRTIVVDSSSSATPRRGPDPRLSGDPGECGSLSWIRTNDQVINSHLLYR